MEAWDLTIFPAPERVFSIESNGNAARSKIDNGGILQRHRMSGQENVITVSFSMANSVFGKFREFHEVSLSQGSNWFQMPLELDGITSYTVVRFIEGKFTFVYQVNRRWKVTAKLELRERPIMALTTLNTALSAQVDDTAFQNYLMVNRRDEPLNLRFEDGEATGTIFDEFDKHYLLYRD